MLFVGELSLAVPLIALVVRIMINLLIGPTDCVGRELHANQTWPEFLSRQKADQIKSVAAELLHRHLTPPIGMDWGILTLQPDKFANVLSNLTPEPTLKRI